MSGDPMLSDRKDSGTPFWPSERLSRFHPNAENRESPDESVRPLKFLGEPLVEELIEKIEKMCQNFVSAL